MAHAATWYLALLVIGAGALLPVQLLFKPLRSAGLLYARPVGLLLVAQAAWLVSAETPVPYGLPLILGCIALLYVWSGLLAWRRPALLGEVRARWRIVAAGEVLTLGLFALATLVRSVAPNATDTEKPMDLMLLSAIREASSMPPPDAWFSGATVSYYHLGHVMVDVIARVAGQSSGVAFNLGTATAGALAGTAVFALAGDVLALSSIRRASSPWIAGAVALVSLLFLATLVGALDLLAAHGVASPAFWLRFNVTGLPGPEFIEDGIPTEFWWWFRSTRILPDTITEFPAFSIILGDTHAHLLALPLAVVALATTLPTFAGRSTLNWTVWRRQPGALLIVAAVYAGLAMTNAWDAAIYGALWGAAVLVAAMSAGWPLHGALILALRYLALPVGGALLIAGPMLMALQSVPFGADLYIEEGSDPLRFSLIWLPLLMPLLAGALLVRPPARRDTVWLGLTLASLVVLVWVAAALGSGRSEALPDRGQGWYTLGLLIVALGTAGAAAGHAVRERDSGLAAWLALAAAAAAIVLGTELGMITDAFANRMNTVFKFWYATWLLLAVAGAAAVGMAVDRGVRLRPLPLVAPLLGLALLVYGGSLLYAPAATVSRAREGQLRGIDALAYLERRDFGAAEAARWAREHLDSDKHVLLEAVGRDYTAGNIVSAASGIPTLLGWTGHELQWRGNISALSERGFAVSDIYRQGSTEASLAIARANGVTHIYIGREERSQFGETVATRFTSWPVVFQEAGSVILEVPVEAAR